MNKKIIFIFFYSLFFGIQYSAHADIYRHTWDSKRTSSQELKLSPHLSHFWSSKNYDRNSHIVLPAELKNIYKTYLDLNAQYGINDDFSIFARLSWSRIQVERIDSGRLLTGTRYGLGDQSLGANAKILQLKNGAWFEIQTQIDFPAYSNEDSKINLTPYLGDQTLNMSIGPFFIFPVSLSSGKDLHIEAGAAFTWRTKKYSSHIPWKLGVFYLPKEKKGFTFSLASLGIFSLKNDKYISRINSGFIAGSSNLTSAANPSYVQIRAQAGYAFSPDRRIYLEGSTFIWGRSIPKGSTIGIFGEFSFGGDSQESQTLPTEEKFVSYDFEGSVLEVNDRLNLLKVDKGTADGVTENQEFDIFSVSSQGKLIEAIARGRVISTKEKEAVIKVIKFYKEVWIERGFIIKRPI